MDDGAFWMSIDDFAEQCQTLNCNTIDPLEDMGLEFKSQGRGPLPGSGATEQPIYCRPMGSYGTYLGAQAQAGAAQPRIHLSTLGTHF